MSSFNHKVVVQRQQTDTKLLCQLTKQVKPVSK